MQPLANSLKDVIHPRVLQALAAYRATGVLDWTPPPGTPGPLDSEPLCRVCNDAGELAIRVPETVHTRYVDCTACDLKVRRRQARMLSCIGADFQNATFERYMQAARTSEALGIGASVAVCAAESPRSMLLWGPYGALKTTLLTAAYIACVESGQVQTALWITFPQFLEAIRRGYNHQRGVVEDEPMIERASTCELLMLDGIGDQTITDKSQSWVQDQAYYVINERSNARRRTFFTSNLDPEALTGQLGGAIVSRISGMCLPMVLHLDQGVDLRLAAR